MSSGYARAGANANVRGVRTVTISGKVFHPIARAMQALRTRFTSKTAIEIGARSNSDERTCKHWLAGNYDPNANALVNLLRSDVGPLVLDALMCEPVPEWYARQNLILDIAASERRAEEARKELQSLRRTNSRL